MVSVVENSRLYMPPEDPSKPEERSILHPETNIDQVLTDAEGTTLREFLGEQVVISSDPPKDTGKLWLRITGTRVEE